MFKSLLTLTIVSTMALGAFAQSTRPQAVNDPNLAAKRLKKAQERSVAKSADTVDPIAMAQKYEKTAIAKWKRQHPTVVFMSQDEYNKLDAAKKAEVAGRVVVYNKNVKWSDIQGFGSEKKQK